MRVRHLAMIGLLGALTGCGGPSLETQTFQLHYIDEATAERLVQPYVFTDRTGAPGVISSAAGTITVRETRDNLERIERMLLVQDRQPADVRLVFTVIRADGQGPVDSTIAPVEAQLRRLFRFRGYRVVAQGVTVASERTTFHQIIGERRDRYDIMGEVESVNVRGDSGAVRVHVGLETPLGATLGSRITIAIGQTAVLGGQSGGGEGALILAVRAELPGS